MTQTRLVARLNQHITRPLVITLETYRALGTILGVLGIGLLAVALYLAPQPATLGLALLGLGLPILLLTWNRPEFGLLALTFLTSSFIQSNIVDLRLPIGGGLDLRDLALIGLFGVVGLRELTRGTLKIPWWPVGGPLLLFLAMAVFSAFYAIAFQHGDSNWALGDLRILSLYTTFYITLWSVKRQGQLKILIVGLFIIADLTTAIVYLQQFSGASNPLLQAMMTARDWRIYGEAGGGVRVIPAGHVLMHFMWFVALGLLLFAPPNRGLKAFCVAQLLYIGGGHLFTYTRAQWLALILGLGLVFIILIPRYKQHLAKTAAITFSVVLLLVGITAGGILSKVTTTPFVAGVIQRFGSILNPSETEETGSLQWRSFEIEKALQALQKQPLTGVGLGNRYRSVTTFQGEANGWLTDSIEAGRVSRFTRYVHNSYMSIAVKMGVPGLIVLLWFCAAALFNGFRMYRDMPDSEYKGMVLGILVGFAGLLFWSYYHAHLIKAESTGTIGLMLALVASIAYIHGRGSVSQSQVHLLPE